MPFNMIVKKKMKSPKPLSKTIYEELLLFLQANMYVTYIAT